jgi:beta-glucosidase/6-phospho-beta-glucosidase/beta-galactosidase
VHWAPGSYDWSFPDEALPVLRELEITPILDPCHFGVPDRIGDFQNTDCLHYFVEYPRTFAARYSWVRLYTPVNEMYVTAGFSGRVGWWNEHLHSHQGFVDALKNASRAAVEAMLAIIDARSDALFVLCVSSEYTFARNPDLVAEATMHNERRFLSLDLASGRQISAGMYACLRDNGMSEEEYAFCLRHDLREHMVMGHDYYDYDIHLLVSPEERRVKGELFGYYVLAQQHSDRCHLPVMHTETNQKEPAAVDRLRRTWANIQQLCHDGVPLCGMT